MRLQHVEAQDFARPGRQQLPDGDEIADRFRHLLTFDLQETVVHPVIRHHRGTVRATRLRQFILVMRKDEIETAAMNIEDIAEIGSTHRGALDVPAWAAPSPRTFPAGLIVWRLPPQ